MQWATKIVLGAILAGVSFAPQTTQAAPEPAANAELPPEIAQLQTRIGAEKFAKLVHDVDSFDEHLSNVVASWDKRGSELKPGRLPKKLLGRLVTLHTTYEKHAGTDGEATAAGMLAMCQWRLGAEAKKLDAQLARAKGGLGGLKSTLADLKARSVDPGTRYPVRFGYLAVVDGEKLENVRETLEDAAALEAGTGRVKAAIPKLLKFAEKRVNTRNRLQRTRETVDASLADMVAALEPAA